MKSSFRAFLVSAPLLLAVLAGCNAPPRFSPDGNKLVYTHQTQKGTATLYLADKDGSHARPLPDSDDPLSDVWSPNSRYIAYINQNQNSSSNGLVTLYDVQTRHAVHFRNKADLLIAWSNDSRRLAIFKQAETNSKDSVQKETSGKLEIFSIPDLTLTASAELNMDNISTGIWLPETDNIAFLRAKSKSEADLYLEEAGQIVRLTHANTVIGFGLLPDGHALITAALSGTYLKPAVTFLRCDADTHSVQPLAARISIPVDKGMKTGPGLIEAVFNKRGDQLIVNASYIMDKVKKIINKIYIVNTDGSHLHLIWEGRDYYPADARWMRNDRKIAITSTTDNGTDLLIKDRNGKMLKELHPPGLAY